LIIHLIYPRRQEFSICTQPNNSMFVLSGFLIDPSNSYALVDFGPIIIHM
jgi:hypothetical protein